METVSINDLIGALRQFKKALKEWKKNTKEPVELFNQFVEQQLLIQRSVFEPHIEQPVEVKDIQVAEEVQSPKDVEVTLEGEPDLDLIEEQRNEAVLEQQIKEGGINEPTPTGL